MKLLHRSLLLSSILTLGLSTIAGANSLPKVSPLELRLTYRVHHCEEPTWHVNGPSYKGGLGWRLATWNTFRLPWMPLTMDKATIMEQAVAMVRFVNYYHFWPDLRGCCGGY